MMVMIMVNIADAKAKLSEFVEAVGRGEQIVICNRNRPVAELRAIEAPRAGPRDLAPMFPGMTFMTDAFFEPMSDRDLEAWYGAARPRDRVAERHADYGKPTRPQARRKRRP
jgi:antitoxin (DNA-binding transcriptional repressor) of toxin-antitoxin stability system